MRQRSRERLERGRGQGKGGGKRGGRLGIVRRKVCITGTGGAGGGREDEGRRKGTEAEAGRELGLGGGRNRRVLQTSKGGPHLSV